MIRFELSTSYRYRGYRYDTETGFYYLQSRYYDPEIGRFINADDVDYLGASGTTLSYNLFAYCENDVVNKVDENGDYATKISKISPNRIRFVMIITGRELGTRLYMSAAGFAIASFLCALIPDVTISKVLTIVFGITGVLFGAAGYIIDKYASNRTAIVTLAFSYKVKKLNIGRRNTKKVIMLYNITRTVKIR